MNWLHSSNPWGLQHCSSFAKNSQNPREPVRQSQTRCRTSTIWSHALVRFRSGGSVTSLESSVCGHCSPLVRWEYNSLIKQSNTHSGVWTLWSRVSTLKTVPIGRTLWRRVSTMPIDCSPLMRWECNSLIKHSNTQSTPRSPRRSELYTNT